jgi:hypothetical protein
MNLWPKPKRWRGIGRIGVPRPFRRYGDKWDDSEKRQPASHENVKEWTSEAVTGSKLVKQDAWQSGKKRRWKPNDDDEKAV